MTESDPLEEELAAFRPCEPTRELKERIADQLRGSVPTRRARPWSRRLRNWSIAGGLATALVSMMLWRGNDSATAPTAPDVLIQPSLSAAFDDSQPSLWTYREALTDPDNHLDALLDRHANRTSAIAAERTRDNAFARFDRGTNTFTGEL